MAEEQRIALVTGGAGAFGSAIAQRLDADGLRVVVADIDEDRANAVADELRDGVGLRLDLTSESSVLGGFDWVEQRLGRLDVLVNNAASHRRETLARPRPRISTGPWRSTCAARSSPARRAGAC